MLRGVELESEKEDLISDLVRQGLIARNRSCGRCIPCREGTRRMLELINRYVERKGMPGDLEMIERLARVIEQTALCKVGERIAKPIYITVRALKDEEQEFTKSRAKSKYLEG